MSYQYQPRDKKPRNEKIYDNSVELFVDSSHASSPGQPNFVINPITPSGFMELAQGLQDMQAMAYTNGAIGTVTGTSGNTIWHSATSRGGIPNQGSPSAGPSSNNGKSRTNTQSDSAPKQTFNGCFKPDVKNTNSFNCNYYGSR